MTDDQVCLRVMCGSGVVWMVAHIAIKLVDFFVGEK